MQNTKVLQVTKFYPPIIGGVEALSYDTAKVLKKRGCDQLVFSFNNVDSYKEDIVDGIRVIRVPVQKTIASQPLSKGYQRYLVKAINDFKPDVIHFHYPNPYSAEALLFAMNKCRYQGKLVISWDSDIIKQKLLKLLFVRQTNSLIKRASVLIAATPLYLENTDFLPKHKDKAMIVPCKIGDSCTNFSSEDQAAAQAIKERYTGKKIVFFFGRHTSYKGVGYLIDSDRYLDPDKIVILIGGSGPMSKKWKEQAKPYSNIVFLGSLPREEINQYLGACDIFAFPSFARNEAFGISLAEALYFGKPAVTFAIPGSGVNWVSLNDVSGLIVPNRDTKAYAEAITKLATDSELYNRLSAGAKERAHTYFTEAYFEKSMNEVYDRVLGVPHSPSEGNKQ